MSVKVFFSEGVKSVIDNYQNSNQLHLNVSSSYAFFEKKVLHSRNHILCTCKAFHQNVCGGDFSDSLLD